MRKIIDFREYVEQRSKVDTNGCWTWQLSKDIDGYGNATSGEKKNVRAHRLSYSVFNEVSLEEIDGWLVCHSCDTPACVNSQHLFLGTVKDNNRDKVQKLRTSRNNNKLTDKQVRYLRRNYSHLILKPGEKRYTNHEGATFASLGREYGVAYHTMRDILAGKAYKHVEEQN